MSQAPPVHYVTTSDGYDIGYAVCGSGQTLVWMPAAIHHIELSWKPESITVPWVSQLSERFRLIQFDGRGQGMSTRNLPASTNMDDLLRDLTAVIDRLEPGRLVFVGHGATSHVAVNYAALHRDRVLAFVFIASSAANSAWPAALWKDLAGDDWENFVLSTRGVSGFQLRSKEQLERMRQTITQADWVTRERAYRDSDISTTLRRIRMPTLVLQPRMYFGLPHEESMRLAALTPESQYVQIDGETPYGNAEQGIAALEAFLKDVLPDTAQTPEAVASVRLEGLSPRQRQVLQLIAQGKTNREIAEALVLSERTVQRHIADLYLKIDVRNRSEATSFALSRLA